jgi:GTP-binding protein
VTVDIRRGFRDLDLDMFAWAGELNIPVLALLSKADKLSRGAGMRDREKLQRAAPDHVELLLFSATAGTGAEAARSRLTEWLALPQGS